MTMQQERQWNRSIFQRFVILRQKARLAHAYLFIGPSNIGKGETASAAAKLMNCEAGREEMFCDVCPSCRKINSCNHPDVYVIDNGYDVSIKIEQVRELLNRNKLRSFMGGKKIFIIKNAENLTLEGANAFLKTLEEPTVESLLFLTTSVPEKILDTIKSRCHAVHFTPMSSLDLSARLREDRDVDEDETDSHLFVYFSRGCLRTARRLKKDRFMERKNTIIDRFLLSRPEDSFIKEILADKERTREFLDILLIWVRDALLMKAGVEDGQLVHLDRVDDLNRFKRDYTFAELKSLNESVVRMFQLLADNLNIKLPLLIIGEQLWGR